MKKIGLVILIALTVSLVYFLPEDKPSKLLYPGHIENLENYLAEDWWETYFDDPLYFITYDNVISPEVTREEVRRIREALGLSPTDTILDLACGNGRHLNELARQGFKHLYGLDISGLLLEEAAKQRPETIINFEKGDIRKTGYPDSFFNVVTLMGNSFGYFTKEEENQQVLEEALRLLKPGGHLLIDNADGNYIMKNFKPSYVRWHSDGFLACYERQIAGDRILTRETLIDPNKGVILDHVSSARLYSPEGLMDAFRKAGFKNVGYNGQLVLDTTQIREGGSMASRMLITGQKP